MESHIEWTSPAALWDRVATTPDENNRRIFRTPAILRFATDAFMPELIDLMNVDPHRLHELLAVPETWSEPPSTTAPDVAPTGLRLALTRARNAAVRKLEARSGAVSRTTTIWNAPGDAKPLKLYQPAHQRYYLVTASLVCRTLGLPDRPLDASKQEKASFVMRMLVPPAEDAINPDPLACEELALVNGSWQSVADRASLVAGEQQQPLSPLTYVETDQRRRRLFSGFIAVGQRESLAGAKRSSGAGAAAAIDPRQMLLKSQVLGPWASLHDVADTAVSLFERIDDNPELPATEKANAIIDANDQIQLVAWYILLDFRKWLGKYLPPVLSAIDGTATLSANEQAVLDALGAITSDGITLREALRRMVAAEETKLETVKTVYHAATSVASEWPSFPFRFVAATLAGASPSAVSGQSTRESLETKIVAALGGQPPTALPDRIAATANANPAESPWFTIRCIFERPNCAALSRAVVSDPSAAFQLAAFFDPDAPARPIRIGLPLDTTPAGLRKFDKNTAFVMSDVLCGQLSLARSKTFGDLVRSVLPWPFKKTFSAGGPTPCDGGGTVCSFSIPIITIVALILLMIFVKLLDIIFFWMPFFQVCLPLPNLSAKREVRVGG
jgi:hypothetical protein